MLNILLTLVPFYMCVSSYGFIYILVSCLLFFLTSVSSFYNISSLSNLGYSSLDDISIFIVVLTFIVLFTSFLYAFSFLGTHSIIMIFLFLLVCCYEVFTTSNLFSLYFFFECSLLPILYIIIKWGSYPERSLRSIIMLFYTLLFGAPFFIILIYLNYVCSSWFLSFIYFFMPTTNNLVSILIFLCFAVKLPIYGIHFWLPIAHVEAPVFGSVILAAILLKLGGVGAYRVLPLLNVSSLSSTILSYSLVFLLLSTLVCCFQSDFKKIIAYSSVSHMMVIPLLILSNHILSTQALTLIILYHGFSSSILFILVSVLYTYYGTRQLVFIRGCFFISPIIGFLAVAVFFFTISAPPFPSFIAEIYFIMSSLSLWSYTPLVFGLFAFLRLIYNLEWLSSIFFSTSMSNMNYSHSFLNYCLFVPIILLLLIAFILIPLFMFL